MECGPNSAATQEAVVRCAYCSEVVDSPEEEHVFPESWYPDGTLPSTMLTVPSCRPCNGSIERVEVRICRSLIMGVHPDNTAAKGVQERVFNSMNWLRAKGKTEADRKKDARVRDGVWKKFRRSTRVVPANEPIAAFPTSRPPRSYMAQTEAGLWIRGRGIVSYDPADLDRITEKFVRGVYYFQTKTPLAPEVPIATPLLPGDPWETALDLIDRANLHPHAVSPAFVYWGCDVTDDSPQTSLWLFLVWNEYVLCGMTGGFANPAQR